MCCSLVVMNKELFNACVCERVICKVKCQWRHMHGGLFLYTFCFIRMSELATEGLDLLLKVQLQVFT